MEEGAIGSGTNFVNDIRLEIAVNCAGNMFALSCPKMLTYVNKIVVVKFTSLREEGAKTLIRFGSFAFFGQVSIRL